MQAHIRDAFPLDLRGEPIAAFLNTELVGHPTFGGIEVQRFDDPEHGRGLLVFLSRVADGRIDVHAEAGLRIDRRMLQVGHGIARWATTRFEVARLDITPDGVDCDVRFTDADGVPVTIRVDDRGGPPRHRGALLAPFGAAVADPTELLLVRIGAFDLVRDPRVGPRVTIAGREVRIGALPGRALHHRHLVKYGTDLVVLHVNRDRRPGEVETAAAGALVGDEDGVSAVETTAGAHRAALRLDPAMPHPEALVEDGDHTGTWVVAVDDDPPLTGGRWRVHRQHGAVDVALDVTRRWEPEDLPPLMRAVTTAIPIFRRWPTTYRWRAHVDLRDPDGLRPPAVTAGWTREEAGLEGAYRLLTQGPAGRR